MPVSVPIKFGGFIPSPASASSYYLLIRLSESRDCCGTLTQETHCDWMPGHKLGSFHWLAVVGDPELHRRGFVAAKEFLERWRTQMQRHTVHSSTHGLCQTLKHLTSSQSGPMIHFD